MLFAPPFVHPKLFEMAIIQGPNPQMIKGLMILICKPSRYIYRQISNISRNFMGNKIDDHSDVFGALPVGAAPTISSISI